MLERGWVTRNNVHRSKPSVRILHIDLPPDKLKRFHELAQESGLSLKDYMIALINEDLRFQVETTITRVRKN